MAMGTARLLVSRQSKAETNHTAVTSPGESAFCSPTVLRKQNQTFCRTAGGEAAADHSHRPGKATALLLQCRSDTTAIFFRRRLESRFGPQVLTPAIRFLMHRAFFGL